jgi:carboxylate-amine ligase
VTAPPAHDYRSPTFDDAFAPDGTVRPAARAVMKTILAQDLGALGSTLRGRLHRLGIRFESVDGDDTWHVDPVPRVIPSAEWEQIAAGLGQRVRALNAFVADVYGERRIVAEGVMPQRVLDTAEGFEPAMVGVTPADGVWTAVGGLDVVRDKHGEWMVLEDNVRTPSGIGYWIAARDATLELLAPAEAPHPIEAAAMALRNVLGPGHAVVLTDGPDNPAHWEHEFLAARMGIPLVVPADLEVRGERFVHAGREVDAIYRRTNADELDSTVGALLHPVLAAGGVKLVNCLGTGVADDKLAHAYVHDMIRFYLEETPLLEQVETFDLGVPATLERALDVFDQLVIKDRGSYGGTGVFVAPHAEREDIEALRAQVIASPEDFVAQRLVGLSTHPTEIDGVLAPRHVDLRPFVLMTAPDDVTVLPGGLTRVALDEGALVVNSSQNGGAKDTWVL